MRVVKVLGAGPRSYTRSPAAHRPRRLNVLLSLRSSTEPGQGRLAAWPPTYASSAGVTLQGPELASLQAFCQKAGVDAGDIQSPGLAQEAVAALARLEDTERLEGAMLVLEQLYLAQRSPDSQQDVLGYLNGKWQMTFATGGLPRRQVVPVPEYFYIVPDGQQVVVETLLGPITPVFKGDWTWQHSSRLLEYSFSKGTVSAWGRQLLQFPFALRNQKAQFFFIGEHHACARSGSGGVILFERKAGGAGST